MRSWFPIAILISILAGCQTDPGDLSGSDAPVAMSTTAVGAIAGDITGRLAEQVPPASTPIHMTMNKTHFAIAVQAALKGWGYTVTTEPAKPKSNAVELSYDLRAIDGRVLAQLSTPTIALGRAYTTSADGAAAASPLSVMQRN